MIWVLVLIFAVMFFLGLCLEFEFLGDLSGFASILCIVIAFFLWCDVANVSTLDTKIAMYEEENKLIEERIENAIISYQKYENETLKEFAKTDIVVAVSLYPELKSDALVTKQLETYIENNNKIKDLKEQRINIGYSKWWLYFGGN